MKPKEKPRKTGSSLMDALGLGKKDKSEVTPGQTATSNRETGAEVISILRSIDLPMADCRAWPMKTAIVL